LKIRPLRWLGQTRSFQQAAGFLAACFLRLVRATNHFRYEPENIYDLVEAEFPAIIAFWHGQHFLMPFIRKPHYRARVLISRHRDGEINAVAAEYLGVETIRGSGDHGGAFHRKGGVPAFMAMVQSLRDGINVALTADVPKVSRQAGLGIIMLARETGRPIVPLAIATSRFKRLKNWDRTTIHLPFGQGAAAVGKFIHVPADADNDAMEHYRQQVEDELNAANRRAYAMLGLSANDANEGNASEGHSVG